MLATLVFQFDLNAQYTVSNEPWEGLQTLNAPTSVFPADDQTVGPYSIGFNFDFFGVTYSQFYISSNGFLAFQNTSNGCCSGQFIPNTGQPNNMIAAFYEDYDPPEGGAIRYQTLGTAPNRILVLEFNGVYPWNGPPKTPSTWQIQLYECSNDIKIACLSCNSDGGAHTQGLENAAGTQAFFIPGRNSTNFSLSNDLTVFRTSGTPAIQPLTINGATTSVQENTAVGTSVITPTFDDQDPNNSDLSFTIQSGNAEGLFTINASTGEVSTNATIDYEDLFGRGLTTFDLDIKVEDLNEGPCRSDIATITINIENDEDEDDYSIRSTSLTNLVSNNSIAQSFLTTETRDLLSADFYFNSSAGSYTLNVYEGVGVSTTPIYTQEFTGIGTGVQEFVLTSKLSLSANSNYTIEISSSSNFTAWYQNSDSYVNGTAYFGGIVQPTRDLYFDLFFAQFNASPELAAIENTSVKENNNPNLVIATAQAIDSDGDNVTYSLAGGAGYFVINPNTGEISTNGTLDYEEIFANTTMVPLQYTLTVTATDDGALPKSDAKSFIVTIENEVDLPYNIGIQTANITLNGNSSIGQSFTTTDAGNLTRFEIDVVTAPSGGVMTVQVWKDSDSNPTSGGTGPGLIENDLVYETEVQVTNSGIQSIVLPESVYLEANTVYTVEMFATGLNLRYRSSNLYRRGRILWSNQLYGCCDLHFYATIEDSQDLISLISPLNGFNIPEGAEFVEFSWDVSSIALDGATYYVVLTTAGREPFISEPLTEGVSSYQVPLSLLDRSKIYKWKVVNIENQTSEERLLKTPFSIITDTDNELAKSIHVYPNPFETELKFNIVTQERFPLEIQIYDLSGRMIKQVFDNNSNLNREILIDLNDYESGLYLYKIYMNKNISGQKYELYHGKILKK